MAIDVAVVKSLRCLDLDPLALEEAEKRWNWHRLVWLTRVLHRVEIIPQDEALASRKVAQTETRPRRRLMENVLEPEELVEWLYQCRLSTVRRAHQHRHPRGLGRALRYDVTESLCQVPGSDGLRIAGG